MNLQKAPYRFSLTHPLARSSGIMLMMAIIPCTSLAQDEPDWNAGTPLVFDSSATFSTPITANLPLNLVIADGVRLRLEGEIDTPVGGIGLIKDGLGRLEVTGDNTALERNTLLREGSLHLEGSMPLGPYYRVLQIHDGTTLSYGDDAFIENLLSLVPAEGDTDTNNDATVLWRVDEGSARHVGHVEGDGLLIKQGEGTLEFAGMAGWPDTALTVAQGRLTLNGQFLGLVSLEAGTTLTGSGRAGSLDVGTGATWAPTGTLNVSRTLTVAPDSTLAVRAWPDGSSDKVEVTLGPVTLAGTVLALPQGLPEDWEATSEHHILQAHAGLGDERFDTVEAIIPWLTPSLRYTEDSVWLSLAPLTEEEPEPEPEVGTPENGTPVRPERKRRWPKWTAPERPKTPTEPTEPITPPKPTEPKAPSEPQTPTQPDPKPDPKPDPTPEEPPVPEKPITPDTPLPPEEPTGSQDTVTPDETPISEPQPEPAIEEPNPPQIPEIEADTTPVDVPSPPRIQRPRQHEAWLATVQNLLSEDSRFLREAVLQSREQPQGLWAKGFGAHARHTPNDLDARTNTAGVFMGVQHAVNPSVSLGAVMGASHSRLSGSEATRHTARARANSVHAGLYAHVGEDTGPQLSVGIGFHRHKVRSKRPIAWLDSDNTALANTRWNSHQVFARVAWPLTPAITPWVDWAWTQGRMPSVTETESLLAIQTQSRKQQQQTLRLGLSAQQSIGEDGLLQARLAWRHHSRQTNPMLRFNYLHDPAQNGFSAQGVTPTRNAWQLAAGWRMPLGKHGQWYVGVDGEAGRSLRAWGGSLRVVWRY